MKNPENTAMKKIVVLPDLKLFNYKSSFSSTKRKLLLTIKGLNTS